MNKEYGITPASNTCCPEMKYETLFIDKLGNGAVWEVFRCKGCGHLKRKFLAYIHEVEEWKDIY